MMAQKWTCIVNVCIYLLSRCYCVSGGDCRENWAYYSDTTACPSEDGNGGVCKLCPMGRRQIDINNECKRKHSNDIFSHRRWCKGGPIPTCSAEPKIANGEVECNGPINKIYRPKRNGPVPMYPDTVCSFSCHPGYILIGSKSVVCLDEPDAQLRKNTTFPFCKGPETHTSTEAPVFRDTFVSSLSMEQEATETPVFRDTFVSSPSMDQEATEMSVSRDTFVSPSMEQEANVVLENNVTLGMKPTEVLQTDTRYKVPGNVAEVMPGEPNDRPFINGGALAAVFGVALVICFGALVFKYKGRILTSSLYTKATCCQKANSENTTGRRTPVENADDYINPVSIQSITTPLSSENELPSNIGNRLPPVPDTNGDRLSPIAATTGNRLLCRTDGSEADARVGYPENIDKSYQSTHAYISLQGGQSSSALLMNGQPTIAPPVVGQNLPSDFLMDEQELLTDALNASESYQSNHAYISLQGNTKPYFVEEGVKMRSQTRSILAKDRLSADGMSEPPTAVECSPYIDKMTVL